MSDTNTSMIDIKPFKTASRLLVEATLRVAPGTNGRFQPTGFPDQGPALYMGIRPRPEKADKAEGEERKATESESLRVLMVQSAAAVVNGLEEVCLSGDRYNEDCAGIPYVRVLDGHANGEEKPFLTSSVREPHRLASDYVLFAKPLSGNDTYKKTLIDQLGVNKSRPVRTWELAQKLFNVDPGCVMHGVFLERLDGRLRLARLVSGYIEAGAPQTANYGGVYRGEVTATDNIPFSRQEFTSDDIKASFVIHLSTLQGYRLRKDQEEFIVLWSLYKIDRFLRTCLRLRTACEFELAPPIAAHLDDKPWTWPAAEHIRSAFLDSKRCFPARTETGDEWSRLNVTVVGYASDIQPTAVTADGRADADFDLSGFEGRAAFEAAHEFGKGKIKKKQPALILAGEWEKDEFEQLKTQNPEKNEQGEPNPAYAVVKKAVDDHEAKLEKRRKKEQGG